MCLRSLSSVPHEVPPPNRQSHQSSDWHLASLFCLPPQRSLHQSWLLLRRTLCESSEQSCLANSLSLCTLAFSFCRVECILCGSSGADPNSANWSCDLAVHLLLQEVPTMLVHCVPGRCFAGVVDSFGLFLLGFVSLLHWSIN